MEPTDPLPPEKITPTSEDYSKPVRARSVKEQNPNIAPFTQRIVLEQPSHLFRKVLLLLLLIGLGVSVMFNLGLMAQYHSYIQTDPEILEKLQSGALLATDKIAIITVRGTILRGDGFVKKQIDAVRKDDDVKGIVLRVDSPGGTVTASNYIYHHLKELQREKKKANGREFPIVVSMGGMAASGGYYISMAVGDVPNTIFAEETTWTGSIGVVIPSYDISGLLKKYQIVDRSYVSGDLKQMGSPTQSRTAEENAKLQQLVDDSFAGFREVIAYGRPALVEDKEAMKEVVTGQIFAAKQAKDLGLVDRLGYLEDAIARTVELAGFDKKDVRIIRYDKPESLFDRALGGQAQAARLDMSVLLDLTAPRAYYLCTWLPAVISNNN